MKFGDLRILNLPIVICLNKNILVDMILSEHILFNHPFKLDYRTETIEIESTSEIRYRYTISDKSDKLIHSFIVF